ncbi:MAG: hypothetical protein MUC68_13985, partial [Burkholderiaceae bacterium]|nr:hypothetical protein [Burkholderiaceae bacterium]
MRRLRVSFVIRPISRWVTSAALCAALSATAFAAQPPVGADTQAGAPAPADTPTPSPTTAPAPLPSFEQLQAAGTLIGEIRIVTQDVFDLDDPRESGALYRG